MQTEERPYDDNDVPEEVEYGLAFAYGGDAAPSVLDEIGALTGEKPSISLRDVDPTDPTPLPKPLNPDDTRSAGPGDKYVVQGVLAEGGIGTVRRGYDRVLGRDVAMKFLREKYKDQPEVLHRFVEEAQIGGQLQHPGIVPVHELGMSEGRPFFTMELVKGQTLARRLAERASPESDRHTFLSIFEAMCQTMAYAHARGVVHRDLKPANVMIGAFGEVQVVDWGMGKVLEQGGVADERLASDLQSRAVETVRSSEDGTKSVLGSVMGTPAYMPPEQARGDVDRMDERSDVFALGAILCEILTGEPPYTGPKEELIDLAAAARLEDAHARLSRCSAETELVQLTRSCLAPAPADRPKSAEIVARTMHDYLSAAEQRAHDAAVRAAALKRTQKLGVSLTVVIALGLAASLWFWRDAEAQRKLAETNLANFDLLSHVVRLETLKQREPALYPASPGKAQALRAWSEDAHKLQAALPDLRATLAIVEARALPQAKAERDEERHTHPRLAELASLRRKLTAMQRARAVRTGSAEPGLFKLDESKIPKKSYRLKALAWPLVKPKRKEFGREAEGLALARRAATLASRSGTSRAKLLHTLAWALFANGLDKDALAQCKAALEMVGKSRKILYATLLKRLEAAVAAAAGAKGQAAIDEVAAAIRKLESEVQRRRHWEFGDPLDQFLHRNLDRLVTDIEGFLKTIAGVEQRLLWAERVEKLTITRYRKLWEEARRAILAADGVTASELYARSRLDLKPQVGLVPIGMNPKTKLWEFYHLRSGWDPDKESDPANVPIPKFDKDGRVNVSNRGMVFVLIPGGRFHMGAQSRNKTAPNYDPHAEANESPVREVELLPYFLSKYEMTQGQWARLTGGEYPSHYRLGNAYVGVPVGTMVPIGEDHPVEHVSWKMCDKLLARYSLVLPTEAQWEYGCRAGTTSPWFTGKEADTLDGFANVIDASAIKAYPRWRMMPGTPAGFEDGYAGPAPVGTYAPNAFGLFDMHGNVFEFARYSHDRYPDRAKPGSNRVARGGSHKLTPSTARSSARIDPPPGWQDDGFGVRPAREIRP